MEGCSRRTSSRGQQHYCGQRSCPCHAQALFPGGWAPDRAIVARLHHWYGGANGLARGEDDGPGSELPAMSYVTEPRSQLCR